MINAYLKDTTTIVRHGALDRYGTESGTAEETVRCFIQWKTKLLRNVKGEEVLSAGVVWLAYDPTLTHEDRIKVLGIEHSIIAIELLRDFKVRAMKVYIQ